jgi:hypothetical protein
VEAAHRVGTILDAAHRELRVELQPESRQTLGDFVALAEAGADALVAQAAEAQSRARAERVVAAYERLAMAAATAPRLREMREYLRATELTRDLAGAVERISQAMLRSWTRQSRLRRSNATFCSLRWERRYRDGIRAALKRS